MVSIKKGITYQTVTIADGATTSEEILLPGDLVGIVTDSGMNAGDITFTSSLTSGGTFISVKDAADAAITITGGSPSIWYTLAKGGIRGLGYLKVVSATSQTGDTVVTLVIEVK